MRNLIAPVSLGLAALALHAATAGQYGYFRDELYFIACAHHLAWGYVDQPPFVALAAWFAKPFGYALLALRIAPIVGAALAVALACEFARALGGGAFARWTAGILTLLAPAYLLLGNTLTTTSFEPLTWMLAAYCALRLVRSDGAWRWWVAIAVVFAFGLYAKYSIALFAFAIFLGILATPERRILRSPRVLAAALLTLVLVLPNLLWQNAHAWPFFEVLRGDAAHRPALQNGIALEYRSLLLNAGSFAAEQILYANPLAAAVWIGGIVAPLLVRRLAEVRFLSVAAIVTLLLALLLGAKGYYAVGLYGPLLCIGCVWLEPVPALARSALTAAAVACGLAAMPFSMPVMPVTTLVAYSETLHLTGANGATPHLVQPVFAEEFGWERLARDVARVYAGLAPATRRHLTIYADTYGDAGALDFFGPRFGLPPAISSQNAYFLWGTNGDTGTVLIAVGATRIDLLRRYYRRVRLVTTSFDPYRWVVEGPSPIYLCEDPVAPLNAIWPHLRWYGA